MSLLKGAFVVFSPPIPIPTSVIIFQFNSETLSRKFEPAQAAAPAEPGGGGGAHTPGPPTETYTLTVDLDASDQLAEGDGLASTLGIHPALAQLELLLFPSSTVTIANKLLESAGSSFVVPAETPTVLFVWGPTRVLPVSVTALSITEQQFDHNLNPIQAKVDLSLTVLTDAELEERGEPFATLGTVMHVAKEAMALRATAGSYASVISSLLPF